MNKLKFSKITTNEFGEIKKCINHNYDNSESSLTNMFIWQHYYNSSICIHDDILYTIYTDKNGNECAFMPYGLKRNSEKCIEKLMDYFEGDLTINLATEDFVDFIKSCNKYNIELSELENSFDYIYNTSDLINLSGRKYHSKKNHINSFASKYDYEYIKYNDSLKNLCVSFCEKVINQKNDNKIIANNEIISINKTFDNFNKLDLKCGIILVNDEIVALSVGERLNDDFALIHIEKASFDFRNAYPVINRLFLINEFSDTKYINREEDMGIAGIRKAKQSYHPCHMIKKYKIKFR